MPIAGNSIKFISSARSFAQIPLAATSGKSEIAFEISFSTTSTAGSGTYWRNPPLLGNATPGSNSRDFGVCIHYGKLYFWAGTPSVDTGWETSVTVNDGNTHDVALVSNTDGSIDLYCDSANVLHVNNVNFVMSNSYSAYLGVNQVSGTDYCDFELYDFRIWDKALSQAELFASIDGTETDLIAWYLPKTENGSLLDNTPNEYHATIYGFPVVSGAYTDSSGDKWGLYGNPTISNGRITIAANAFICGNVTGGHDFTVDVWSRNTGVSGNWATTVSIFKNFHSGSDRITTANQYQNNIVCVYKDGSATNTNIPFANFYRHYAIVYEHDSSKVTVYLNGVSIASYSATFTGEYFVTFGVDADNCTTYYSGYFENPRITNEALWTKNFNPEGFPVPAIPFGFTYLDSTHYVWYNPGLASVFETRQPSPYYETRDEGFSRHRYAIETGSYRFATIGIPSGYQTNETFVSFNIYRGNTSLAFRFVKHDDDRVNIISGGETLTDIYGGTENLSLGLHHIVIHAKANELFEWYLDGTLIASYTTDPSGTITAFKFVTTSGITYQNFISDVVITNDQTTGQKLITDPDSVIDGDSPKITEYGYADIYPHSYRMENGYADTYRRIAEGGDCDIARTSKRSESGSADIFRKVLDSRSITEEAYADISLTVKREENALADIERIVFATVKEEGDADIVFESIRQETGDADIERKTPHRVIESGGKMYLGGYPVISVEVSLQSNTLSDSARFWITRKKDGQAEDEGLYPKEAMVGNILDYNIDFEIESTEHQEITQTLNSIYNVEQILYKPYVYSAVLGAAKASAHANKIAAAMGLNPVIHIQDFTPENNYSGSKVTYQNILSGMFGWTRELPWRNINIFIRDGNMYVVQRGYEPRIFDITNIPHSRPLVNRSIVRNYEAATVTNGASAVRRRNVFERYTGYIYDGMHRLTYVNGLCTEERTENGDWVRHEYDANTEQVRSTTITHADGSSTTTEYIYGYSRNGQVVATTEVQTTIDTEGNRDVKTTYNSNLGNGATSSMVYSGTTFIGSNKGYGGLTGTATEYTIKQANIALGARPKSEDVEATWENPYPLKDADIIQQIFNEIRYYDRRIEERISLELIPPVSHGVNSMSHVIDFNDRILLDGKTFFIESNTVTQTPTSFRQALQLVRWL